MLKQIPPKRPPGLLQRIGDWLFLIAVILVLTVGTALRADYIEDNYHPVHADSSGMTR